METLEIQGFCRETARQKQILQSICDRGILKIKQYIEDSVDNNVRDTAAHFADMFNEMQNVADQIDGSLTKEQRQKLRNIYTAAVQRIRNYEANFTDSRAINTAVSFRHLFEEITRLLDEE